VPSPPLPGPYRHLDGCDHELQRTKSGWQMRRRSCITGTWSDYYPLAERDLTRLLTFGNLTPTP
jgi:hypothetical protein